MTEEEISRIKKHIEIHARQERRAVIITRVLRKAVDELEHIADLERENAELKKQLNKNPCVCNTEWYCSDCLGQLTKAKELLKQWLQTSKASGCDFINIVTDTEQFLKDSEGEK